MKWMVMTLLGVLLVAIGGYWWRIQRDPNAGLAVPFMSSTVPETAQPLLKYSIPNLAQHEYFAHPITVEKILADQPLYTSYLFSFQPLGRRMTGMLNVPKVPSDISNLTAPTIVMLRGYVPIESYDNGIGTRNSARLYADAGFVTVAPDFFGYGGSDPEPSDVWQARFEKPMIVAELIKTLETTPIIIPEDLPRDETLRPTPTPQLSGNNSVPLAPKTVTTTKVGMWGHSNGGQIALTTLEVLGRSIPTTLWAPVTAPFPYSILFFTDENSDEGKESRAWLAQFEQQYDVFEFSLTQHLERLNGPLQLHHGTADEAALKVWSDEFLDKVQAENQRRETENQSVTDAASVIPNIDVTYYTYPDADHNLQPGWDTVVERDIEFFTKHLIDIL